MRWMVYCLSLYYAAMVYSLSLYYAAMVYSLSLYYAAMVYSLSLYYTVFIIYRLCPNIDCVCICKGCLINKRTVYATQHNAQVIWCMTHGCLCSYLTVSRGCFYRVCRSSVAVGKAARWSLLEYLYLLRSADLYMPFTLAQNT